MSAQQIMFFKKNKIDLDNPNIIITATDVIATDNGQNYVDFMRNRNLTSAYMTTGSTDAANTTLVFETTDEEDVSEIIIVGHNLKSYTLKYWNGSSYVNFSTPINVSGNTATTNMHSFTQVSAHLFQLIITGTQVTNDDKQIKQIIFTEYMLTGQLNGFPVIKSPTHSSNKKINKMLSGKSNVVESIGAFSCDLNVANWRDDDDLTLVEELYFGRAPALLWLSGGDQTQFSTLRVGYRLEDFYLIKPVDEYQPEWYKGLYQSGMKISLKLQEVVD